MKYLCLYLFVIYFKFLSITVLPSHLHYVSLSALKNLYFVDNKCSRPWHSSKLSCWQPKHLCNRLQRQCSTFHQPTSEHYHTNSRGKFCSNMHKICNTDQHYFLMFIKLPNIQCDILTLKAICSNFRNDFGSFSQLFSNYSFLKCN